MIKFTIPKTDIHCELWFSKNEWSFHYWCLPSVIMDDEQSGYTGGIRWAAAIYIGWLEIEFNVLWD